MHAPLALPDLVQIYCPTVLYHDSVVAVAMRRSHTPLHRVNHLSELQVAGGGTPAPAGAAATEYTGPSAGPAAAGSGLPRPYGPGASVGNLGGLVRGRACVLIAAVAALCWQQ